MQKTTRLISIVTVCVMIITMFSGCGVLQKLGLQKNGSDELHPVSSIVMNEDEAKRLNDKVVVRLYFADPQTNKLKAEVRYISASEARKSTNSFASTIMKELIKGPATNKELKKTMPEGTQVNKVTVSERTATVDLNKAFIENHPGGKISEQLTLYSISNTLTELKEIEKVKFTIDGKKVQEFKGNLKLDAEYEKNPSLIVKDTENNPPQNPNAEPNDSKGDATKGDTTKSDATKGLENSTSDGDSNPSSSELDSEEGMEDVYVDTLE